MKNLNETLSHILTEYPAGKLTNFWNKCLPPVLFATKVTAYKIMRYLLYNLLYAQYLSLPSDENPLWYLEMVMTTIFEHE